MKVAGMNLLELGQKQVEIFLAHKANYCEILVTCACPRHILVMAYENLVRQFKIAPVEDMLLQDKEFAWGKAKEIAKGRLGKKELVEIVKALVAIEYFLNL